MFKRIARIMQHIYRTLYSRLFSIGYSRGLVVTTGYGVHFYRGDNVYIGLNALIRPGARSGNRVIIGAGSAVRDHLPASSDAAGMPARAIKNFDDYKKSVMQRSLHLGLKGEEKVAALKAHFKIMDGRKE